MEILLKVLTKGAVAYAVLAAVVFWQQDSLIYLPNVERQILQTPKDAEFDYETVWLTTEHEKLERFLTQYLPEGAANPVPRE